MTGNIVLGNTRTQETVSHNSAPCEYCYSKFSNKERFDQGHK